VEDRGSQGVPAPPSPEAERVLKRLLRVGIDETPSGEFDWRQFAEHCGLGGRTPEDVQEFVDAVLRGVETHPGEYGVTPRKARHAQRRRKCMHGLRAALREEGRLRAWIAEHHWRGFPSRWTPDHEVAFFREFLNVGFGNVEAILKLPALEAAFRERKPAIHDLAVENRIELIVA
jgi:hypothetical protein